MCADEVFESAHRCAVFHSVVMIVCTGDPQNPDRGAGRLTSIAGQRATQLEYLAAIVYLQNVVGSLAIAVLSTALQLRAAAYELAEPPRLGNAFGDSWLIGVAAGLLALLLALTLRRTEAEASSGVARGS